MPKTKKGKIVRGYFGIGIFWAKNKINVGTLWRSAQNFNASFIFTIGKRYKEQCSDTTKTYRHIPLFNFKDFKDFKENRPMESILVGIEQSELSKDIVNLKHPKRAIYLLGSEGVGLPDFIQKQCQLVVHISTPMCLNVAVAGSIIMYDRFLKKMIKL